MSVKSVDDEPESLIVVFLFLIVSSITGLGAQQQPPRATRIGRVVYTPPLASDMGR